MENDCIDCKKNTNERFVRWQQITLKELGKVISLFLGIEFATIGFVVTQLTSLNLTCKNYWSVFLMMLGTVLLLINIIMFLYLTLNRLTDFRKTTQKIKAEKDKNFSLINELDIETKKLGEITWSLFESSLLVFGISEGLIILGFVLKIYSSLFFTF